MKAWLGLAAIGGIGFGIGFFAGERFGRKKQADEQRLEREEQEHAAPPPVSPEPKEPASDISNCLPPKEYNPNVDDIDLDAQAKEMNEYFAQFESPNENDDYDPDLEDVAEKELDKPKKDKDYIRIVNEDFWNNNTIYDPNELRYFEEDEVVADESDERVEDPEDSIGHQVLEYFNDFTDLDVQYVLNTWTMEVFKITRVHDAYARAILGLDEDFEFYKPHE